MVGFGPTHVGSNPTGAILPSNEASHMKYLRLTASEIEEMCDKLARIIKSGFKPDCIVGIGRGGLVPAVYLSDRLGVKKLYAFKIDYYTGDKRGREPVVSQKPPLQLIRGNVLLVDDVADTGETLMLAKKLLEKHAKSIRIATLHYKPHSKLKPDFFVQETRRWIVYPYQSVEFRKLARG